MTLWVAYDIIINVDTGCSSVWLERYLGVVEAVGSSPVTPTKRNNLSNGFNASVERLFLYQIMGFGQILVKSGQIKPDGNIFR